MNFVIYYKMLIWLWDLNQTLKLVEIDLRGKSNKNRMTRQIPSVNVLNMPFTADITFQRSNEMK